MLLGVVLLWPLLTTGGLPLARDLVFSPRQPWRLSWLGLGDAPARAVPLDAVVSLADGVLGGPVVARVALVGILVGAGMGAHRLLRGAHPAARGVAVGMAVWNPFVVERLALGQWALLVAYAATFAILATAGRYRFAVDGAGHGVDSSGVDSSGVDASGAATVDSSDSDADTSGDLRRRWWSHPIVPVLAAVTPAAITPTGAMVGGAVAVVAGWPRRRAGRWLLAAVAVAVQLPWLLPTLLGAASLGSDPNGVNAFAARAERPGGPLWSLVGLGGIWDASSVPPSRAGLLGHVLALAVVLSICVGLTSLGRLISVGTRTRLVALGVAGFALAAVTSVPGGTAVLRWAVATIPGAGVLRDSQKWLLPCVVLVVLVIGAAADRGIAAVGRRAPEAVATCAMLLVGAPIVLLPDAPQATWATVRPVTYPADLETVARIVDGDDQSLVTLPWHPYRRYEWGNPLTVYDPVSRYLDIDVVMSDRLQVGHTVVMGESARARTIDELVSAPPGPRAEEPDASAATTARRLADNGVRWLLVQQSSGELPAKGDLDPAAGGFTRRYAGHDFVLWEVPGPWHPLATASTVTVTAVAAVDGLILGCGIAALGLCGMAFVTRATRRRKMRRDGLPAGMLHRTQRGS